MVVTIKCNERTYEMYGAHNAIYCPSRRGPIYRVPFGYRARPTPVELHYLVVVLKGVTKLSSKHHASTT